jgi:predicted transcriptional regulator
VKVIMPRRPSNRPTDAELSILDVLWKCGPCTVKQVHECLKGGTGYTTVLKILQIMTAKGLVLRDESQRAHVYRAARSREATQRRLLGDLVDRVFDGSAGKLVLRALAEERATPEEIAEIRRLLDAMEKESSP